MIKILYNSILIKKKNDKVWDVFFEPFQTLSAPFDGTVLKYVLCRRQGQKPEPPTTFRLEDIDFQIWQIIRF